MRNAYMDNGAGMPLDARVFEAMKPYFFEKYGNASSAHSFGNEAKQALATARQQVVDLICAEKPQEIVLTPGFL